MRWFGEPFPSREHPAPMFELTEEVETPVGEPCLRCEEPIEVGDRGVMMPMLDESGEREVALHYECHIRSIMGSVKHIRGECGCVTGKFEDDDAEYATPREAARAALDELIRIGRLDVPD